MGKEEAFAKVGTALEGVEGVTIASRAQLLGSYDVAYEGSNFLVRVVAVDAGAYISAVDPRGLLYHGRSTGEADRCAEGEAGAVRAGRAGAGPGPQLPG